MDQSQELKNIPDYIVPCGLLQNFFFILQNLELLYFGNRSFALAAPVLWNNLPDAVKYSVPAFKSALKTFLFNRSF
jgi:hypothetical protein